MLYFVYKHIQKNKTLEKVLKLVYFTIDHTIDNLN